MPSTNTVVAMFDSHVDAERAVHTLDRADFNIKSISLVGKGAHTEESVVGYYNTSDRMQYWGTSGAYWGGLWGLLFGSAMFMVPGVGPMLAGGPVVAWIVAALESALVVGGLSAIGAGLYSIGIPKDSIVQYEVAVKDGKFMLVASGTADEVERANAILKTAPGATDVHMHFAHDTAATVA